MINPVRLTPVVLAAALLAAGPAWAFGHRGRAPHVQNNIVVGAAPAGGCCGRAPHATIVQRDLVPVQHSYYQRSYATVQQSFVPVQQSFVPVQQSFVPVQRSYTTVQQQTYPSVRSVSDVQDFVPVERQVVQRSYVPVERTFVQRDYVPVQTQRAIVQQDYAPATTTTCQPVASAPALAPSYDYGSSCSPGVGASFAPSYGTADYTAAPGLAPGRGVIRHRERTVQRSY